MNLKPHEKEKISFEEYFLNIELHKVEREEIINGIFKQFRVTVLLNK